MSKIVERLISEARCLGACNKVDGKTTIKDMAELFFTPQGREFCLKHNYPSMADFRQLRKYHASKYGIFCDAGSVLCEGCTKYCGVGETRLQAKFDKNNDKSNVIVLMHGAKAHIDLSNYAVVRVEKTDDCEVTIDNDGTGIVLW